MSSKAKKVYGWSIACDHGLYVGWRHQKYEAIAEHVHDMAEITEEVSKFATGGRLNDLQREIWKRCRKRGDRAVKVTLTYDPQ